MSESYEGRQIVGMDLHRRRSVLVRMTESGERLETVRRDFVANVSHELKTPVGALSLLAEAVLDASEDPVAIKRFAGRMQVESARLTELVRELLELSRLQADDPLRSAEPVDLDHDPPEEVARQFRFLHRPGLERLDQGPDRRQRRPQLV